MLLMAIQSMDMLQTLPEQPLSLAGQQLHQHQPTWLTTLMTPLVTPLALATWTKPMVTPSLMAPMAMLWFQPTTMFRTTMLGPRLPRSVDLLLKYTCVYHKGFVIEDFLIQ